MFDRLRAIHEGLEAAGGTRMGAVLWWALANNRISHERLADLVDQHGLDRELLPKEIKPAGAFRRAWRHAARELPPGQLLRPIVETPDEIVLGLVREDSDGKRRELDYELITRVSFRKDTAEIKEDVENAVTQRIRALHRHHQEHTTTDIRGMITSFLSEKGVPLRSNGGVYFVPERFGRSLDALCRVVESAGHNQLFRLPIVETPETTQTLGVVAERSLEEEVRQLQAELDRFDADRTRPATLERRVEDFETLRGRVRLFSSLLSFEATGLTSRIDAAQRTLRDQLGLQEVEPEHKPTPNAARRAEAVLASDVGF